MRTLPVFALLLAVLVRPVLAEVGPTPSPEAERRIAQAADLIKKGKPKQALSRFIEPTIAEFEKEYGPKVRIYCARTGAEGAYYLAQSSAKSEPAIVISQAYANAYYLKGYLLVDRRKSDAALPFLLKAVELSPWNAQYLSELAHVYQLQKNWHKALDTFVRAADAARKFSSTDDHSADLRRALRGQGYSLYELGRFDDAEERYHRCLELDPYDTTAKDELRYIRDPNGEDEWDE